MQIAQGEKMDFNKNSEITADEIAEAMTKETPWQIRPEMVTKIKQNEGESGGC